MINRRRVIALSAASALGLVSGARAQTSGWPNRYVRLVVPFPPGGGTDAIARVVAGKLSEIWGQQVVVENRGGGATNIGTEAVSRAEPDGYTMLLHSMPLAVNKFLFASLPYDPVVDLAPVSLLCDYPNIMAVPNSSPERCTDVPWPEEANEILPRLAFAYAMNSLTECAGELFGTAMILG